MSAPRFVSRTAAASLICLSFTLSARAAGQDATSAPSIPVAVVQIDGKAYDARRDDTATKIVVNRDDIVRYGETNLTDVLKRLPGISVDGVQGRRGAIRMRGLGGGYTQILLNGEAMPAGFNLEAITPDLVERVEILRSATADLSTQGIAGTINIVLRKIVTTAQQELKLVQTRQHGRDSTNLSGRSSDKLGKLSYSLAASMAQGFTDYPSFRQETAWRPDGMASLTRDTAQSEIGRSRNMQFTPRATLSLANGDLLSLQMLVNLRHLRGRDNAFSYAPSASEPGEVDFTDLSRTRGRSWRNTFTWNHQLAHDAALELKLGTDYGHRDVDTVWQEDHPADDFLSRRLTRSRYSDIATTLSGKYTYPYTDRHLLSAGWDGGDARRLEAHSDITNTGAAPAALTALEDFHANVRRIAWFAQDEWRPSKSLSLYAGARWESIDTRNRGTGFDTVGDQFSVLSPIVQLLWKLPDSKNDQLRLAFARTFKGPDANALTPRRYVSDNNSATNPDSIGNPHLRPELSSGVDGALEHFFAAGGTISVSVYARRIKDVTLTETTETDGRWAAMSTNGGRAHSHGIELEAKFPFKALCKEAPAIDFHSNAAFNWSTLSSVPGPDNRLYAQTPVSASVGLDYQPSRAPVTVGGSFTYQGGGPVRISMAQRNIGAVKRVLDFYGLWKVDPKMSWRFSLGNLLRQDNISTKTYLTQDGGLYERNVVPTSATLRVILEQRF